MASKDEISAYPFNLEDRTFIMVVYNNFEVTYDDLAFAISQPEHGTECTASQIAEQYDKLSHSTDTDMDDIAIKTVIDSNRKPEKLPSNVLK
ncbi:MAG: hypothetical protein Q9183_003467, partial [Haloplaca sp. 2 TL-2023]